MKRLSSFARTMHDRRCWTDEAVPSCPRSQGRRMHARETDHRMPEQRRLMPKGGWLATRDCAIVRCTVRDIQPENAQQIAAFRGGFAAAIMRLPQTRRGAHNLTRIKTNISGAARSHYTPTALPSRPTLQFETLLDD